MGRLKKYEGGSRVSLPTIYKESYKYLLKVLDRVKIK